VDYKIYYRKSSFKKDKVNGDLLLDLIFKYKPKNFLEIGVLEGVTSRNVCELLYQIHKDDFKFTGVDLFGIDLLNSNTKEFTPISNKISNPLKWFFFKFILRIEPHSKEGVDFLLKKFGNSINILKGNSNQVLNQINLKKIDFVFLDGGHSYETVKKDLQILTSNLDKNSVIVCDDYNLSHYGVKDAVDEISINHNFKNLGRFALIKILK
jgi:predicted O-methyltransferase YrrM